MNDIRPGLPKPVPGAPIKMKGVKPVGPPPTPQPKKPSPEPLPDLSQPLSLPQTLPEDGVLLERPRKHRVRMWIGIILAALVVVAVAVAAFGYFWYQEALNAYSTSDERIRVIVEDGQTADQVATELEQKHLIKSALALQIYMKLNGKGQVKAGNYLFSPNQAPAEILQWLVDGKVDTFKVLISPGLTLKELKESLKKYNYTEQAIDAAFAKTYDHALFADKPAGASLEGYIFPETYFVTSDTTVEQLLVTTFDEFEKQITNNNLRQKLAQHGFSLYQGITLASIIEKEVHGADQKQVAQVFETRLAEGMTLGSDVTYHYAADQLGVEPSPDVDSPYNTRIHAGLPPGPIANFNLGALQAVADPAPGDYLFFVAGDDGHTYFAHTSAEHEANISEHCQKLCSQN